MRNMLIKICLWYLKKQGYSSFAAQIVSPYIACVREEYTIEDVSYCQTAIDSPTNPVAYCEDVAKHGLADIIMKYMTVSSEVIEPSPFIKRVYKASIKLAVRRKK